MKKTVNKTAKQVSAKQVKKAVVESPMPKDVDCCRPMQAPTPDEYYRGVKAGHDEVHRSLQESIAWRFAQATNNANNLRVRADELGREAERLRVLQYTQESKAMGYRQMLANGITDL